MGITPVSIAFPLQKVQLEAAVSVQRMALDDMRAYGEVLVKMMDSAQEIAEMSTGENVNIVV